VCLPVCHSPVVCVCVHICIHTHTICKCLVYRYYDICKYSTAVHSFRSRFGGVDSFISHLSKLEHLIGKHFHGLFFKKNLLGASNFEIYLGSTSSAGQNVPDVGRNYYDYLKNDANSGNMPVLENSLVEKALRRL